MINREFEEYLKAMLWLSISSVIEGRYEMAIMVATMDHGLVL